MKESEILETLSKARTVFVGQDNEGRGLAVNPHEIKRLLSEKDATIERMKENMHTCPDCGFEFHHYGEKSCPECENDRKDATIEELKDESDRINNHLFNACKDVEALRKALDDIKPYIQSLQVDILNESPSYLHNAINLILHKINTALGEGDMQKVTVTLHNRGYEKHELDFGEGDKE